MSNPTPSDIGFLVGFVLGAVLLAVLGFLIQLFQ